MPPLECMGTILLSLQIEVRGDNYTFPSSEQIQVSLLLNQLSVNLTKGERLTLRAFAMNSVGTSDPVSADVIVPCELWTHIGQSNNTQVHIHH